MLVLKQFLLWGAAGTLGLSAVNAVPARGSAFARSSATAAVPSGLLDLNTAGPAELAALPGMGVVYAKRVVEGRPYSAKNQLVTRGILPAAAYERIKDHVIAHRAPGR